MREHRHEVIYRDGRPTAVILAIDEYEELLERVEDLDDLRALRELRGRAPRFRRLDDYLADRAGRASSGDAVVRDVPARPPRVRRTPRSKR
jgi:PHD/YefM family antitoxin component YafN of YafNO toxin-antitoxin module